MMTNSEHVLAQAQKAAHNLRWALSELVCHIQPGDTAEDVNVLYEDAKAIQRNLDAMLPSQLAEKQ
jgi:hypothetical protein